MKNCSMGGTAAMIPILFQNSETRECQPNKPKVESQLGSIVFWLLAWAFIRLPVGTC